MTRIGIVGAGAWGTALAQVVRRQGNETILYAIEPEVVGLVENPLVPVGRGDPDGDPLARSDRLAGDRGLPGAVSQYEEHGGIEAQTLLDRRGDLVGGRA